MTELDPATSGFAVTDLRRASRGFRGYHTDFARIRANRDTRGRTWEVLIRYLEARRPYLPDYEPQQRAGYGSPAIRWSSSMTGACRRGASIAGWSSWRRAWCRWRPRRRRGAMASCRSGGRSVVCRRGRPRRPAGPPPESGGSAHRLATARKFSCASASRNWAFASYRQRQRKSTGSLRDGRL